MTKKQAAAHGRLQVKLQSFYKTGPKEAQAVFEALEWAYEQADQEYYGSSKIQKTLARLRDLAAVAVKKPTLAQIEEEDY